MHRWLCLLILSTHTAVADQPAVGVAEPQSLPAFITMYGDWESAAVRSDPPAILDAMPYLKVTHYIKGIPAAVCPGIRFEVEQIIGEERLRTELTYGYDAHMSKSLGVIQTSGGATSRAVIDHGSKSDLLKIWDAGGALVWTETKTWISPDAFESEAEMSFEGSPGRVWFMTTRVGNRLNPSGSCAE